MCRTSLRADHDRPSQRDGARNKCRWRDLLMVGVLFLLTGCAQKMAAQPRYDPLAPSDFFANGQSAQPLVPDTVSRSALAVGTPLDTGKSNGKYVTSFPMTNTREMLARGQERYDIYCAVCHDRVGTG